MKKPGVMRVLPQAHRPWNVGTTPAEKVHTGDSRERVAECLRCEREDCVNCFGRGNRRPRKGVSRVHEL